MVELLAVDRSGQVVVMELKRTEDGGHMELQAPGLCGDGPDEDPSTSCATPTLRTPGWTRRARPGHAGSSWRGRRRPAGAEHPGADSPRRFDFSRGITSTGLWLRENHNVDATCVRLVPYRHGGSFVLDGQQIIPLPEAAAYRTEQERKQRAIVARRGGGDVGTSP